MRRRRITTRVKYQGGATGEGRLRRDTEEGSLQVEKGKSAVESKSG